MPTETDQLLGKITAKIETQLFAWYGSEAVLAQAPELQPRNWSFFVRYLVQVTETEQKTILVKIRHQLDMDFVEAAADKEMQGEVRQEYQMLVAIDQAFQENNDSRFCAIRPLTCFDEWNALVMEELPCRPLKIYFKGTGLVLDRNQQRIFESQLREAARWLRIFHDKIGDMRPGAFFSQERLAATQKKLQTIDASHRDLNLLPFRKFFDALYETCKDETLPVANLHGDFNLANIIFTDDNRIGTLDPAGRFVGPIYADLATLLAEMQTRAAQVLTYGRFVPPARLKRFTNAVLEGYFEGQPYDPVALNLHCLLAVIEKWETDVSASSYVSKTKQLADSALRGWKKSYFTNLMRQYVAEIQKNLSLSEKVV